MIKQLENIPSGLIDCLVKNHYRLRIKSHLEAYGTSYNFCRFYLAEYERPTALLCVFNSTLTISRFEDFSPCEALSEDVLTFIEMNKPRLLEADAEITKPLEEKLSESYSDEERTMFEFREIFKPSEIIVDELPRLDDVYKILKESFHELEKAYGMWLTDTSHRVRRGLSQTFLYGGCTTATIQYLIESYALVGHVATLPEFRGRHYARELLYWIGDKLSKEGFTVRLFARAHRVSYYDEIGFVPVLTETVFERKINR
ncbi:MAG: GNAT family N-acetyltransferase [Oscillospiraceae bacterium]|jgi:GNAT superfamily N-acetyltransferase